MEAGAKLEWSKFDTNPGAIEFSRWSLETLGSTDAQPTFISFDQDFDSVVYENEFMARIDQEFVRLDKNGDGVLDRSEMIIAFNAPTGARGRGGQAGQGRRGNGQRGQGQRGQGQRPQR